ncbi:MAG: hypothetical protein JXL97_17645 [Bacteroidales bacterium]|nr:hypothetical protein [Bacteroidales bacterium]
MKILILFINSFIFLLLMPECNTSKNVDNSIKEIEYVSGDTLSTYQESLNKWIEMRDLNGNSYIYQSTFASWVGFGFTTEIKVENGIVTERKYESFNYDNADNERKVEKTWVETGDKIGSHKEGHLPLTIDQLYQTCAKEYLVVDTANNTIYFETTSEGVLTTCGYYPHGCADDCYEGIDISGFEWIKNEEDK